MARLTIKPGRDSLAGNGQPELDLDRLLAEPPLPLDDLFDDSATRDRIGRLIGNAMRPPPKSDLR
jgi:hypothetical protein